MVATKKSKTQTTLKQSTLSFASKRAHSSKLDEKKQVPIRKTGSAPTPVSAREERVPAKRPRSPDPLEISSDIEDESEIETPASKRETVVHTTPPVVEEIERERLNARDRKWNKHYVSVKESMGGLPAGEWTGSRSPYLAGT